MNNVKPYKIIIEWKGEEDFYFICDYARPDMEKTGQNPPVSKARTFPVMAQAMGNVLRKLRKEHIAFPLFLVALAFATSSAKENRKVAQAWRLTHSPIEHTEQWKQGQSKRALRWHHDPTNCGARLLRAQRISASKKAKSKPLLEKTCPTCMKTFFIKFKERNRRIYCSKSCASRRRWQSCKENS